MLLSPQARVTRDSKGNFYAAPTVERGVIGVFDSAGRFVRTLGKAGQGPGEFMAISHHTVGRGDTLHIIDATARRYSKVALPNGSIQSTSIATPGNSSSRFLPSGEIVVRDGPRVGATPVAVFGPDGVRTGRTATSPALDRSSPSEFAVIADANAVWKVPHDHYVLEKWSLDDRRLESLARTVPWFPSWPAVSEATFSGRSPMPAMFVDGVIAANGMLWTFVTVPGGDFRPLAGNERVSAATMSQLVDTYMEVIDVGRRQVIITQRFPEYLLPVHGTPYVYGLRYTSDAIVVADVYLAEVVMRQ